MTNTAEDIIDLGGQAPEPLRERVEQMPVRIRRMVTTDEGKLQIVFETEGLADDDSLGSVKDMLTMQQAGMVLLSLVPVQQDLFDA